tara:strand:- start:195 stop:1211 length:1017 start_codon:yes stop_codon:yes gene_type:complete
MKKLLLILFCLPLIFSCGEKSSKKELEEKDKSISSQEITTNNYNNDEIWRSVKIKTTYNEDGNILEKSICENDKILNRSVFKYEKGYLIEILFYNEIDLSHKIKYYRDDRGNITGGYLSEFSPYVGQHSLMYCLCKIHTYVFLQHIHHASCDFNCKKVGVFDPITDIPEFDSESDYCEEDCEYEKYSYSLDGRVSYSGNSTSHYAEEFDSDGKLIETYQYSKGDPEEGCSYKYNTYGDLIEEDCCCYWPYPTDSFSEDVGSVTTFKYEYDKNGNKLKRETYSAQYTEGDRDKITEKEKVELKRFEYEFDYFGKYKKVTEYINNNQDPNIVTTYEYKYY